MGAIEWLTKDRYSVIEFVIIWLAVRVTNSVIDVVREDRRRNGRHR